MTFEELKSEAEEYRESITQRLFNEDDIESAWQRGAEFGYNKANEWHSYAERPKEKLNALCFDIRQNRFILGYYDIESDEWIKYGGYEIITIDLWKKIVPPELPKEIG